MSNYTVTTSSELMENYIQADILLPQDKFLALQTNTGASLLFSIGTGGVFNLCVESPGQTHGWRRFDLSGAQIKKDFGPGATCKDFAAAQAVAGAPGSTTQIHLAMVINDGTNDHLYISLNNSDSDLSWTTNGPAWTVCPFNAADSAGNAIPAPSPLTIAGVFISEAADSEYIVIDAIRNPTEPVGVLSRFYLDVTTPAAPKWTPHDLSGDIAASAYQSTLGRAAHAFGVDGIYTKGVIANAAQLLYTPLYNAFDPTSPALPSRLGLPGGLAADAIAAARNSDNTSDLYAASQGGLYYFASANQKDGAVGTLLVSNPLLTGVRSLYAYPANGSITVWGLNGSDQVFYLTCPQSALTTPTAWNIPLIIMSDVDAISPYVDRAYSANTFFAHGAKGLLKTVKAPATGMWSERNITLPPSDIKQDATTISSYTTHIQVTDANGHPAANVPISVTATNVTTVYINHLYYIIGSAPVQLTTDAQGTVTVVETATTLAGTRFTVVVDQQPVPEVNPMDNAFKRNAQYTTKESLRNAQIVDRDGTTRPFIPAGTSDDDLSAVASSNQNLAQAYDSSSKEESTSPAAMTLKAAGPAPAALVTAGLGDNSILVDAGDLFRWLESEVEAVISFVKDAAEEFWHIVVEIAGQVYHGILNCVEKIVAAATWLYNAIKVVIQDIIQFFQFLFGWQDILTTHKVLKNFFIRTAEFAISDIDNTRTAVINGMQQIQANIDNWAQIPNWGGIPTFDQTSGSTSASNPPPAGQNSAPSNLGVHHFKGNCASSSSSVAPADPVEAIFSDLIALMNKEGDTLAGAANEIKTQIIDQLGSLSVTDLIKRFLAIVADTIVQTAETAITTMLDVIAQLLTGMMDILTATIDIPVLSWLYKQMTQEELSFIDLLCLISAIPATLIYKIATDKAPFPQGDAFTNGLINAASFADIKAQFLLPQTASPMNVAAPAALRLGVGVAVLDQAKLKVFGFATGICAFVGSIALAFVTNVQRITSGLVYPKTLATVACVCNILYVSPNIATLIDIESDNWYSQVNNGVTAVSILKGMAAIPAATASDEVGNTFAFVETLINAAWNMPVVGNIIDNKDAWNTTYKSLIPESIGNFAFNIGGMLEFPFAMAEDPKAKLAVDAVQTVMMLVYGAMMVVAGSIYEFAPDQQH